MLHFSILLFFFTSILGSSTTEQAHLIPVLHMQLEVGPTNTLFTDKTRDIDSILATLKNGNVTTVENDMGFTFEVRNISGYGSVISHLDQNYGYVDEELHGITPDGLDVKILYTGILSSPKGDGAGTVLKGRVPSHDDYYMSNTPRFYIQGEIPESLQWVAKENFIGWGSFSVINERHYGQYTLFVIR